jgi:charged multivesicular body protein 1
MEDAMGTTTTLTTPKEQVDSLIAQIADEHGLDVQEQMSAAAIPSAALKADAKKDKEQDDLTRRYGMTA